MYIYVPKLSKYKIKFIKIKYKEKEKRCISI
jgi:hypothetical protein